VLCDTHDTSILFIDTYVTIPVSPRSRYTAVYRSSTKYRETAQVSRVSTIPCSSYHLATCTLQACDAETNSKVAENHNYHSTTMSARVAVNKYNPIMPIAKHRNNCKHTPHTSSTVPHSTHYAMQCTIARHNVTSENRLRYM